jgi:hypothetical protein
MKTKIIEKGLEDFTGDAWLVELEGTFFCDFFKQKR